MIIYWKDFYSEFDYKNSFMLYSTETIEEKKIPLMKLFAAVVEMGIVNLKMKSRFKPFIQCFKALQNSDKSCYIIDRPKLYGKVSKVEPKTKL